MLELAQINVAHNPDLVANSRNGSRSSGASAAERSSSATASSVTSGPAPPVSSSSSESAASAESGNIHRNLMDLDDGVVVMHVGPNGFTIDSISTENNNDG
ncbi:unnamed protein product [Rotaria socialis]|uniref:Uncharacterized protein n=1 Tax=Rotaria socialis TaxID=392032 RepID=A0A818EQ75_9BILA|nr:unnamed protein product [Rotaria socialis]